MLRKFITQIPFNIKLSFISFFSFILIFNIWRLVFLYFYIDDFNASPFLYLQSFYFGYTLDAILASILTLPITIISFIPKIKFKGCIQFSYYCYLLLLYVIIGFLNVVTVEFFKEFGSHLNMQAQMYGFDSGKEAWIQMWVAYPVFLYLFLVSSISYIVYKIVKKLINLSSANNTVPPIKIVSSIFLCLLISYHIIGGINKRAEKLGSAYFTKIDNMANQLAVNSVYNYINSLIQHFEDPPIKYYKNSEQIVAKHLQKNRTNDNEIEILEYDIKPNVILIILESHAGDRCNFLNPNLQDEITPNLDKMAKKSINFKNCYANGPRTAHGLSSILCSWPTIPGYPLIRQSQYKIKGRSTLASIFKDIGYETGFLYGGNSEFDEMKSFALINSFDKIYDHKEDDYLSKFKLDNKHGGNNPWGVFDEFLFNRCLNIMNERNNNKPIMLTLLTTTNHAPWVIPEKHVDKIPEFNSDFKGPFLESRKTMRYVDFALGDFIEKAKKQTDWFENTIFIITADHGLNIFKEKMNDPRNGHIPFIIYNSNFEPITIDKLVSHVDMLPTILDLIGQYDYYNEQLLGSSAFRGDKGFVFRNNDYNMQYIENNWVYSETIGINFIDNYPLHKDCTIVSPNINMLQEQCRAHVQSAFYKQKK